MLDIENIKLWVRLVRMRKRNLSDDYWRGYEWGWCYVYGIPQHRNGTSLDDNRGFVEGHRDALAHYKGRRGILTSD